MIEYEYKARDGSDTVVCGAVRANSPRQARDLLRQQDLWVVEIFQRRAARRKSKWMRRLVPTSSVTIVLRELATLLKAGIPLMEALNTEIQQHKGRIRDMLEEIRGSVSSGASLAEAFSRVPDLFDELSVRMVEVGESSGALDTVLMDLAEFKQKWAGLKNRVVSSLVYPFVVLLVSGVVMMFLMVFVVPMILSSLIEAGHPLPWPTRIIQRTSSFVLAYGVHTGFLLLTLGAAVYLLIQRPVAKKRLHDWLLCIPLIGQLIRKQAISRVAFVIATLLRSGVAYLPALELAAKSCQNLAIRSALLQSKAGVTSGEDISLALSHTNAFPPMVLHIFSVGQQSGNLDVLLYQLSSDYDQQVETLTTRMTALLEPVLIVFLAVFVGFILFATLLPILEAGHVI